MIKDLDLNSKDKISFEEFVEEKQPHSNEDRYAVVAYYLSTVLDIEKTSINHIGTVFRLTKSWKEPTNLWSGLRAASSRKGMIDTSDSDDIKITPAGRNFVEHHLPLREKTKK